VDADGGGVHIFSGIPNRAFALSALAFGGNTWEKVGKIWWNACITHRDRIPQSCTFLQFADVTVGSAKELYGVEDAKVVRGAWETVGVVREA
jgi:Zn-dependent metalloprotease